MTDYPVEGVLSRTTVTAGSTAHDHAPAPTVGERARRRTRLFCAISFPIWVAVAIRAAVDTSLFDGAASRLGVALLLVHVALLLSERAVSARFRWYPRPYFALQTGPVPPTEECAGAIPPPNRSTLLGPRPGGARGFSHPILATNAFGRT